MNQSCCHNDWNAILAALPDEEHRLFREHGESAELPLGAVLYHVGDKMDSVYFPTSGLISLLGMTQEGHSIEVGAVGREGFLGLPIVFGKGVQSQLCMVQQPATAVRVPADLLKQHRFEALHRILLRYAGFCMMELSQSALCNQFHPLKQRLCRWLLASHHRTGADKLAFTQDLMSQMLGARRPVVTVVARHVQREGAIEYRRGCITILNRRRLEQGACECHRIVRKEFDDYLERLRRRD